MGKMDVRNYLESIYNIPVAKVHTRIERGKISSKRYGNEEVTQREPTIKHAYVHLKDGSTFKFPEMFPVKEERRKEMEEMEKQEEMKKKKEEEAAISATKSQPPDKVVSSNWFNI